MSSLRVFKLPILFTLFFTLIGCSKKEKSGIENLDYKISNFLNTCQSKQLDSSVRLKDPLNTFSVQIPSNWDKEEVSDETANGIFAMDTTLVASEGLMHSIFINVLINQTKSLPKHFADDILGMKQDSLEIVEIGEYIIPHGQYDALWVIAGDKNSKTLIIYSKGPFDDKMLIASVSVSSGNNYRDRLCSFRPIIDSIKFNNESQEVVFNSIKSITEANP